MKLLLGILLALGLAGCVTRERVVVVEAPNQTLPTPPKHAEPVKKTEVVDCQKAVLNASREPGKASTKYGPVASGRWYQDEFAAVYFFNTIEEAWICDSAEEVAVWDVASQRWKRP